MLAAQRVLTRVAKPVEILISGKFQKRSFEVAIVRHVVVEAEALLRAIAVHDVAEIRHNALQAGEVFAVVAELHQIIGFGGECELRVHDLVAVCAQRRRPFDANEKIGVTDEGAVEERGLIDHAHAIAHRLQRPPLRFEVGLDARIGSRELLDLAGVPFVQSGEVPTLVLFAFAPHQVAAFVGRVGFEQFTARDQRLQLG